MTAPLKAVLVGAGNRGADVYGAWALAHPDQMVITAVAEPVEGRRRAFAARHGIPPERQFTIWEDLFARPQLARAAIIATQDQMHTGPALAALKAGYDVLLEKPMAHRLDECIRLVQAAERTGRVLQVCHVLRYTDFFRRVYEIVRSGRLGQVITVSHRENVSALHMAHSYVRGNWRRADEASPMILAKCCHDLDLLYWILGQRCVRLSSVGGLTHFRPENAPPGAPDRCLEGCPVAESCPFYAPALYDRAEPVFAALARARKPVYRLIGRLGLRDPQAVERLAGVVPALQGIFEFRRSVRAIIAEDPDDPESVHRALLNGPYGRCVYHCDNDVVDHQIVAMEFEGGVSASLTMHGHSHEEGRTLRVDGSRATLLGKLSASEAWLEIHEHRGVAMERIEMAGEVESGRHGGGDDRLMTAFVAALRGGERAPLTSARASLESHLMAFAAEQARVEGQVIEMDAFRAEAEKLGER